MSAGYQRRLERDLDRWIAAGWVSADRRGDILGSLAAEAPRLSASATLGVAGAVLLGLAAIAFIAANWDGLPRLARLFMILAMIWAGLGAAIWAGASRPRLNHAATALASLAFASGVGLVAQMYQLSGDPWAGLAAAAVGAFAIGFATGSVAGAYLGVGFGLWAYISAASGWFDGGGRRLDASDLLLLGIMAAVFFARRRFETPQLTHVLALLAWFASWSWLAKLVLGPSVDSSAFGVISLVQAGLAAGVGFLAVRRLREPWAPVALGYSVWAALLGVQGMAALAHAGGAPNQALLIGHSVLAIAAGIGAVAFGRAQRHAWATGGGVVFTAVAVLMLMNALALDLMTIAAVFCLMALAAIIAAFWLARRRAVAREGL